MKKFFTVVIPHYKHRKYLEVCIESVLSQIGTNFDLIISDDCSPDDSEICIPTYLKKFPDAPVKYIRQEKNLGYDRNLRFCINQARGEYILMLGNDDALQEVDTLHKLEEIIRDLNYPDVCVTSYTDYESHDLIKRAQSTRVIGNAVADAVKYFRTFSFFSGLVFKAEEAQKYDTSTWDHSIYYQFYLATKIICEGGKLAMIELPVVRYCITIDGEKVPTAAKNPSPEVSIRPRYTGHDSVIRVMINTLLSYSDQRSMERYFLSIFSQIYLVSYISALFTYRIKENWSFSFGVARNMFPSKMWREYLHSGATCMDNNKLSISFGARCRIFMVYLLATLLGLLIPKLIWIKGRKRMGDIVRQLQAK